MPRVERAKAIWGGGGVEAIVWRFCAKLRVQFLYKLQDYS